MWFAVMFLVQYQLPAREQLLRSTKRSSMLIACTFACRLSLPCWKPRQMAV